MLIKEGILALFNPYWKDAFLVTNANLCDGDS